jgi:hypothetical protein
VPGYYGLLVSRAAPRAHAEELGKFTNDLAWAKNFGEQAAQHVRTRWSVERATDQLEAELQRVLRPTAEAPNDLGLAVVRSLENEPAAGTNVASPRAGR